jgi:hypothetical protein
MTPPPDKACAGRERVVQPSYNHARWDSKLTPCIECADLVKVLEDLAHWQALAAELAAHLREVDGCGCIAGDDVLARYAEASAKGGKP